MNLYVHIPFCLSKCAYCALYSEAVRQCDVPAGFAGLYAAEFSLRTGCHSAGGGTVDTAYFGGGTPQMLGLAGIGSVADGLSRAGLDLAGAAEWSVELNPAPELCGAAFLDGLLRIGVNRLSFGVQSLDDATLARAGRRHTAGDAIAAVGLAHAAGFANVGIDLIAGLPGESMESWRRGVETAIGLGPEHVSVYSLIVEPGTPLSAQIAGGGVAAPGDGDLLERIAVAGSLLASAGYNRYEISNWARPGRECVHNVACWRGDDYFGLGPGASSRIGLRRRTNARDWRSWRAALLGGNIPPASEDEALSDADDIEGRFVFGLRMAEGVSPGEFAVRALEAGANVGRRRAVAEAEKRWRAALAGMEPVGIVRRTGGDRWALTARGIEVADSAIERLMA